MPVYTCACVSVPKRLMGVLGTVSTFWCSVCTRTFGDTNTRVQVSRLGVSADRSVCVFACRLQTCFHQAQGEAVSHLQGILATAIPRKRLLPAGAAMSQQRLPTGGALSPWRWPLPSPGLAASPGSLLWHPCPRTHSWNWPAQAAKGFFPPPPAPSSPSPRPVPPHTRLFIFPSCCRTKTPHSRVQELQPNGGS